MKSKLIYSLVLTIVLGIAGFIGQAVLAQTASPSAEVSVSSASADKKAVEDLKEKVANKVAEIRKKDIRAVAGKAISISSNSIKIKKDNESEYEIKIDEALTKYFKISGGTQKEIKKDDIEKNDYIIVSGVITDKTVTANSIFVDQPYIVENGKITEVDKENYNITVLTADKSNYKLSIEDTTKQQIVDIKTLNINKSGFSKIIVGDSVHFVTKSSPSEDGFYKADKILIVPQEYFMK